MPVITKMEYKIENIKKQTRHNCLTALTNSTSVFVFHWMIIMSASMLMDMIKKTPKKY